MKKSLNKARPVSQATQYNDYNQKLILPNINRRVSLSNDVDFKDDKIYGFKRQGAIIKSASTSITNSRFDNKAMPPIINDRNEYKISLPNKIKISTENTIIAFEPILEDCKSTFSSPSRCNSSKKLLPIDQACSLPNSPYKNTSIYCPKPLIIPNITNNSIHPSIIQYDQIIKDITEHNIDRNEINKKLNNVFLLINLAIKNYSKLINTI